MRTRRLRAGLFAVVVGFVSIETAWADHAISFDEKDSRLAITIDQQPFAVYVWRDPEILRPYFADIHAPNGVQVTRRYPPQEGQDPTDHATMHPGLWLAFGDLSGADFWRNKDIVSHTEFIQRPKVDDAGGSFAVRNRYSSKAGKTVCEEACRFEFAVRPSGYLITWDSQFSSDDDFYFGDQEEMGLGVRVATPITVKNGGQIANSDGLKNEKQVWGQQAAWCDYAGTIDGAAVGVLLMADPQNLRLPWFHARDYGLLVANPFGQNAFTKEAKSKVAVSKGETLRLRFGVLVHSGKVELPAAYRDWISHGQHD